MAPIALAVPRRAHVDREQRGGDEWFPHAEHCAGCRRASTVARGPDFFDRASREYRPAHGTHALLPDGPRALHVGRRQRAAADDRRRRHRGLRDPRRQRQPDRAGLGLERDPEHGLGPRLPAGRAGLRRGRRARRHARDRDRRPAHARAGAGRRSCPGSGCSPTTSPSPTCASSISRSGDRTLFREDIVVPLSPFMGTMGVCPAGASALPVMPPGTFGGNLDTRQLVKGTTLYLPGQVEGALFSTGDAHGCQGDGEICVTGLEAPMYAVMRFSLEKGRSIPAPQYRTAPGPLTPERQLRRLLRHHRRRRRPLRDRPGRDPRDDRPPGVDATGCRARTPTCSAAWSSTSRSPRSSTRASTSSPPSSRSRSSSGL